jgi:hypothetical protein
MTAAELVLLGEAGVLAEVLLLELLELPPHAARMSEAASTGMGRKDFDIRIIESPDSNWLARPGWNWLAR